MMIPRFLLSTLVLTLLTATPLIAKGVEFHPVNGESIFGGIIGVLPEGGVNCIGGEPTGGWPVCSPDTIHSIIRGVLLLHYQTSCDSPFTAIRVSVLNANLDQAGQGPMWGTWKAELDSEDWGCPVGLCVTEGTFIGKMDLHGVEWEVVGQGTEGTVEGTKIHLSGVADEGLNEDFSGYYFETPEK